MTPIEKYRPSNGTEGELFREQWCLKCCSENEGTGRYCEIMADCRRYSIEDENYPTELIYDEQGNPCCTAWNVLPDNTARVRAMQEDRGQMRLF